MKTYSQMVSALKKLARSFGGDVRQVTKEKWDVLDENGHISHAPFTNDRMGIDWKRKVVYFVERPKLAGLIHEMGHVFVAGKSPNELDDEWSFFGWEYIVAKKIGLSMSAWVDGNKDYIVDPALPEFGSLSEKEIDDVCKERVAKAQELKLVRGNQPVSIR